MRDITINIHHSLNVKGKDIVEVMFELQGEGDPYSKQRRIIPSAVSDVAETTLTPVSTPYAKSYGLYISPITQTVFSVTPYKGVLYLNNLPLLDAYYTITANYPIVLTQERLPVCDEESVKKQFCDGNVPSCTLVTTAPSANIIIAGLSLFNVLKLQCLETAVNIQGAMVVNRLEGWIHSLLNAEHSMIRVQESMSLESHEGGITNHGMWDASEAQCTVGMKYLHNMATGKLLCGTLNGNSSLVEGPGPFVTNDGYLNGKRLTGHLSHLVSTKGSETYFKNAGVVIKNDVIVAGVFVHEDSAKYTVDKSVEVQAGGHFFAKRSLQIAGADCITVRKEGFLGAKFSFDCPSQHFITEKGSYYGCPGYTTLTMNGRLSLEGQTVPGFSLLLKAQTLFTNIVSQQKRSHLNIRDEYRNAGLMSAEQMEATAGSFVNMPGGVLQGDTVTMGGEKFQNAGTIHAEKTVRLKYKDLIEISQGGLIKAKDLIELMSADINNHGVLQALKEISVQAGMLFKNTGGLISMDDIGMLCITLINVLEKDIPVLALVKKEAQEILRQLQTSQEFVLFKVKPLLQFVLNHTALLLGEEAASIPLINPNAPMSPEAQVLLEYLRTGVLTPNAVIRIKAGNFENEGNVSSFGKVFITTDRVLKNVNNGHISGRAGLAIVCGTLLENTARISAYENIRVTAKELLQALSTGTLMTERDVQLILETSLVNAGTIKGKAVKVMRARVKQFLSTLYSGLDKKTKAEAYTLSEHLVIQNLNAGLIEASDALTIFAEEGKNAGSIKAKNARLYFAQHFTQSGTLSTEGQLSLEAGKTIMLLQGGHITAKGALSFLAKQRVFTQGDILAYQSLTIITDVLKQTGGKIEGRDIIRMTVTDWILGGNIKAQKSLIVQAQHLIDIASTGFIAVQDLLELTAYTVNNHGALNAIKEISIQASLLFKNTGTLSASDDMAMLCVRLASILEKEAIPALARVKQEAKDILRQLQSSTQPLQTKVKPLLQFVLNHAALLTGQEAQPLPLINLTEPLSPETQVLLEYTYRGVLSPEAVIRIKANTIENTGNILSIGQVFMTTHTVLKNLERGVISGSAGLAIICGTLLENTGNISAYQDIRITAKRLLQALSSGKILSRGDVQLILETSLVNAGVILGKKVEMMRAAMKQFLETIGSDFGEKVKAEAYTLSEYLCISNLSDGLIKASDALLMFAGTGDNAGKIQAQHARLYSSKDFTQSGTLSTEEALSLEAGRTIMLLQRSQTTAKGAMALLAKQKVFTQGDILAYQSLAIITYILEQASGNIEGHEVIQLTVSDWILGGNIKAQRHLIAKIKNCWDWKTEGTFSAGKEGAVSLTLDRGYSFTRPITLDSTFNIACDTTATLHNLTAIRVGAFGVYGGTFNNGSATALASVTTTTGKYTAEVAGHDNIRGGLYTHAGFDITSPSIVNGREGMPFVLSQCYMRTPGQSSFKGTLSNCYSELTLGSKTEFLGEVGTNVIACLSGDMYFAGDVLIRGTVTIYMRFEVTNTDGITRARALSKEPLFRAEGGLTLQGLFNNSGGKVWIGGETHASQGGFNSCALEEYDAWTTTITITTVVKGDRRGGVAGLLRKRHTDYYHDEVSVTPHRYSHGVHLGDYTFVGKLYSHDAGYFNFISVRMENGMEGQYRYFGVHQPFDTTTLAPHIVAQMGLYARSLHLEGATNSQMVFNNRHIIAEDFVVNAPEGSFTQNQQTRTTYEQARLDRRTWGFAAVTAPNPGTGYTQVGGSINMSVREFRRTGGELSYGRDSTFITELMETLPLRTTHVHNGGRGHTFAPEFTPAITRGQGNLHIIADTLVGNGHYIIKGQAKFEYMSLMILELVCEYYRLPDKKKKKLFKNVYSGGITPVILENVIDASLGVVFVSTNGRTTLENTLFPSGQPIFHVPQDKLQRTFHYPQAELYSYSQLNLFAQLGAVALAAAAAYFTGGLLTSALLPAAGAGAGATGAAVGASTAGAVSSTALTAAQTVLVGAAQGAISGGVHAGLTNGNIAKSMFQGAVLGGFGAGVSHKLQAMNVFSKVTLIDPETLRRAAVSVPVAMAASGMNNGNLLKGSLQALANSLIRSALPGANSNELSLLGSLQQEATNACIAGMTMAVLTGSNKKQIMNLGLQSAGCAVANLAGERLGTSIVESHLALQQANRAESVTERAPAVPNAQTRRQAAATSRQIQRPPRPNRAPPARPTVADPTSTRRSGLIGSDFERELNEAHQTTERLTLSHDVANTVAETSGGLRNTLTQNHVPQTHVEPYSGNTLLWRAPNRPTPERSFPVSNNLQSLATVQPSLIPSVAQTQTFTRRPPPPPPLQTPARRVPPPPPPRLTESISPTLENRLATAGTQALNQFLGQIPVQAITATSSSTESRNEHLTHPKRSRSPRRAPPPRPMQPANSNTSSTRHNGLMGGNFELELSEVYRTTESLVLQRDSEQTFAETTGGLRETSQDYALQPNIDPESHSRKALLWSTPSRYNRTSELSFNINHTPSDEGWKIGTRALSTVQVLKCTV